MSKPIFVKHDKFLKRLQVEQVAWLVTEKKYTHVYMTDLSYFMIRSSLSKTMGILPAGMFIRIHRSFVVSVQHIQKIYNDHLVVCGEPIPVSRQYYESLMSKISVIV